MTNLNEEFFTKFLGWVPHWKNWDGDYEYKTNPDYWQRPDTHLHSEELPNPAGCWNDFREWVVPELMGKAHKMGAYDRQAYLRKLAIHLGAFYIGGKPPKRALDWAIEELKDAS